ncbi:MAG: HDIG domain-containing protein [Bacteroidetes bacterium]|nr:HDIG domain-containing protein [Bacteroidota bacterium]
MMYNDALMLMHSYVQNDALRKHMYAVECAMRAYARKFGENEELWAIVGLLHDFDYEKYPYAPDHPLKGAEILRQLEYPEEIINAILGHATYTNVTRSTLLAKTLYACDELCGFINAVAIVRPNKILDLEVSSVKKKLKDKGFARNINRDDVMNGAMELGLPFDDHVQFVITALRQERERIGL